MFLRNLLWTEGFSLFSAAIMAVRNAAVRVNVDTTTISEGFKIFGSELVNALPTLGIIAIAVLVLNILYYAINYRHRPRRSTDDDE